jgi:hypothetical protein
MMGQHSRDNQNLVFGVNEELWRVEWVSSVEHFAANPQPPILNKSFRNKSRNIRNTDIAQRRWAVHIRVAAEVYAAVNFESPDGTVDVGRTPTGILPAHLADQISDLTANDRSTVLAAAHLPGPEQPKARRMPSHDRFGLDDDQCRAPVAPNARQPDPQWAVPRG